MTKLPVCGVGDVWIRTKPTKPSDGLAAFASFVLDSIVHLGSVGIAEVLAPIEMILQPAGA